MKTGGAAVAPRFSLFLGNFGKQASLKRKGRREISLRPEKHPHELVSIVIMVIPVAIGMPAVAVFVPPTMPFIPAAFPGLAQFVPRTIRLLAVPTVVLDGFVQFVVRLGDATLASIVVFGVCTGHCPECQQARESHTRKHRLSEKLLPS
jgi:hypothetical protein